MTRPLPELTSVARIAKRFAFHQQGALPGKNHAGLPVPVPGPDGVRVAIFFTTTEVDEATSALRIQAPGHVVYAQAATSDFIELCAITPRDLGIAEDPGAWLGDPGAPADPGKVARLLDLYDAALPAFAGGPAAMTAASKRAAIEIKTLFHEVEEPPLAPYYAALGKRFFAWIDKAAAS